METPTASKGFHDDDALELSGLHPMDNQGHVALRISSCHGAVHTFAFDEGLSKFQDLSAVPKSDLYTSFTLPERIREVPIFPNETFALTLAVEDPLERKYSEKYTIHCYEKGLRMHENAL